MLSSAGAGVVAAAAIVAVDGPPKPKSVCPNFEGPAVLKAPKPPDLAAESKPNFPFWPKGEVVEVVEPNADAGCPKDGWPKDDWPKDG